MRSQSSLALVLLIAGSACAEPTDSKSRSFRERIENPDREMVFNMEQMSPSSRRPGTYQAGKSPASKEFYFVDKTQAKTFNTRGFAGAKSAWMGEFKFSTKDADAGRQYKTKDAPVKTAKTKDARESSKSAPTRELRDANRDYRGPEADRIKKAITQEDLARIDKFERKSDLRKLESLEDIRTLLNKN